MTDVHPANDDRWVLAALESQIKDDLAAAEEYAERNPNLRYFPGEAHAYRCVLAFLAGLTAERDGGPLGVIEAAS